MSIDYDFELLKWMGAIEAADTWCDSPGGSRKKASDLRPLMKLLCSGDGVPEAAREHLKDLLMRHRLKATGTRTPSYTGSDSEAHAHGLMEAVADFRSQPNFPRGRITKDEMTHAIAVMQKRASARGQANKNFDGMTAARDLREEIIETYADYYGIRNLKEFKNALEGKHGPINRIKATVTANKRSAT